MIKRENLITFSSFPFSTHVDSYNIVAESDCFWKSVPRLETRIRKKERKAKEKRKKRSRRENIAAQDIKHTASNPRARGDAKFLRVCGRTWHVGPCVTHPPGWAVFRGARVCRQASRPDHVFVSRSAIRPPARYAPERNKGFNGRGDERCRWSVANNQAIQCCGGKQARDLKARSDKRVIYPSIIYSSFTPSTAIVLFFFPSFFFSIHSTILNIYIGWSNFVKFFIKNNNRWKD